MSSALDGDTALAAHPLLALTSALESLMDDAGNATAWTLTPSELEDVLPRLTRAKTRLTEVELRVLHEANRHHVGEDVGATNTPA
jgi:hypothetical protein